MSSLAGLPPGPPGALLQLLLYTALPGSYVALWSRWYGDLFAVPTPFGPVVVVASPSLAREVLTADQSAFTGFASESFEVFLGPRSLMLIGGEDHRRERKVLAPLFQGARMRSYGERIAALALRHLRAVRPGETFSAADLTQRISLSIIIEVLFGVVDEARARLFEKAVLALVESVQPAMFFFRALRRGVAGRGPWVRFQRAAARLDALLYEEIAARRTRADQDAGERACDDALSGLLRARYDDGRAIEAATMRDQLVTLLVAGHETTGLALGWALARLHRDAEALTRVRRELDLLGSQPAHAALEQLPFLEAVCHETLRLDPIVPEFMRQLLRPMRLFGRELPAGTGIAVSAARIHQREDLYPDAAAFRPERFLGRTYAPHEYLPFGGGAFRCLGGAFAMLEMQVILATLLRSAELELVNPGPLRAARRNWVVGPAGDVPMRVRRYHSDPLAPVR